MNHLKVSQFSLKSVTRRFVLNIKWLISVALSAPMFRKSSTFLFKRDSAEKIYWPKTFTCSERLKLAKTQKPILVGGVGKTFYDPSAQGCARKSTVFLDSNSTWNLDDFCTINGDSTTTKSDDWRLYNNKNTKKKFFVQKPWFFENKRFSIDDLKGVY